MVDDEDDEVTRRRVRQLEKRLYAKRSPLSHTHGPAAMRHDMCKHLDEERFV